MTITTETTETKDRTMTSYFANHTGQITIVGVDEPNDLRIHEDVNGAPLCNNHMASWRGHPAAFTPRGPGQVTCGNCQRTANDAREAAELAKQQRIETAQEAAASAQRVAAIRASGVRMSLPGLDAGLRTKR